MCGICGELSFSGERPVSGRVLDAMSFAIRHRGPDHTASYVSPDAAAGLGFRRLSIIDLRSEAPTSRSATKTAAIQLVFNGEIYNYQDLRRGLVARGHQFRSNSDSEVIVHLYEELGDRAIDELDGMFALGHLGRSAPAS